jgi:hypothetical protein
MRALPPALRWALCAACMLASVAGPAASVAAPTPVDEKLSNERTVSYWAFAGRREPIRTGSSETTGTIASLRLTTELHAPEPYLVLRRRTYPDGESWLQVRIPMRPNGRVGWVPEDALGRLHVTYTQLTISLAHRRATLYKSGTPVWRAPVGIGKPGTPTPAGRFYVRERLHLGGAGGPYGAFAFGTSAYSAQLTDWPGGGVIGIHGTDEPGLIPGRISHGCVRVRNADIDDLRRLMGVGTPITIR